MGKIGDIFSMRGIDTLAKGADPAEKKQSDKRAAKINVENTFSAVAKAYLDKNRNDAQ